MSTTWALCPNSTGRPSRPLAIGRASPSCRLTRRVAPSGVMPGDPLAGLRHDLPGRGQQLGQVVDRAGQPPAPPPRGRIVHTAFTQLVGLDPSPAQRPLSVGEQPFGLLDGGAANSASSPVTRRTVACASSRPAADGSAAWPRSHARASRPRASDPAPWCAPRRQRPDPLPVAGSDAPPWRANPNRSDPTFAGTTVMLTRIREVKPDQPGLFDTADRGRTACPDRRAPHPAGP